MTVLMTVGREYGLDTARWEITWQGTGGLDGPGIRVDGGEPVPVSEAAGFRRRAYAGPGVWLLDLDQVHGDHISLVVTAPDARRVALTLDGGADVEALHHPGLETVAAHRMRALTFRRGSTGWTGVAEVGYDPISSNAEPGAPKAPAVHQAPEHLQPAALDAQADRVVESGQPVVLVVDCSASMRARFVDGTVSAVAVGAQSLAVAAGRDEVELVAVGARRPVSRTLAVRDQVDEVLRALVAETGLVTGMRGATVDRPGALVVSVGDGGSCSAVTAAVHVPVVLGADAQLISQAGGRELVTTQLGPEGVVSHVGRASAVR